MNTVERGVESVDAMGLRHVMFLVHESSAQGT